MVKQGWNSKRVYIIRLDDCRGREMYVFKEVDIEKTMEENVKDGMSFPLDFYVCISL